MADAETDGPDPACDRPGQAHRYRDHYFPGTEVLNDDEMRVTALGTGRPFVRPAQANASWLVELGSGEKFLFDFGYGSFANFTALEIPCSDITALFASHLHADHVGDFGIHWIASWVSGRLKPLEIYGPSGSLSEYGIRRFVEHQVASYAWDSASRRGHLPAVGELVAVHEFDWAMTQTVYESGDVKVRSFPAVHFHDGAIGYRLDWRGLAFVYSGDTAPNTIFVDNAAGGDLVIHEVFNTTQQLVARSGLDVNTADVVGRLAHTQPVEAGQVFELVRPRLAVAYHFFNDFDTRPDVESGIRNRYDGPLRLAQDLMVFNVRPQQLISRMAVAPSNVWPSKSRLADFAKAERGQSRRVSDWLASKRL